jgi:GT2 family glycosyltransferase
VTREKNQPLVSIVVLNWNGLKDTLTCLEHLARLDYQNYEIIVVDNGSTDGSKDVLSKYEGVVYVDNATNRGFTGGHIDGLAHCSGELVVLLNNDAVMKSDYLKKALPFFDDEKVAAVGGRSYWWDEENALLNESNQFYSYQEINIFTGEAHMLSHDYGAAQEVNNVSGSCVVVRRSAINKLGYLYDRYFAYFEETDLFARLKRAELKVLYSPELHIWHRNGASSGSSSGSHFFYYQIFRNRFIFATRNFEARFLWRFWLIYGKISLKSAIRWLLGRGDKTMNRAYAKAAAHNLITLPYTLCSRWRLTVQLGKSSYNHQIYTEQSGTSIVVDCSNTNLSTLNKVVKSISSDKNPLHEYVIVSPENASLPNLPANARYVIDKGYFDQPLHNLGCVAARFSWMLICNTDTLPEQSVIDDSIVHSLSRKVQLLGFRNEDLTRAPYYFLHKGLFERTGGGFSHESTELSHNGLFHYADRLGVLRWHRVNPEKSRVDYGRLSAEESDYIKRQIKYDQRLLHSNSPNWFTKLQHKYYRFYQVTTLVQWLFVWRIPIRLKLARIKNVVLSVAMLQMKPLAVELKHMHNEVVIFGGSHFIYEAQQKHLETAVEQTLKKPTEMPVFIICYERFNALKQLVSWFENHNFKKIVFIDNDSSYPELTRYYESSPYQVIRLMRNEGHTAPWSLGIIRGLCPHDFYLVSDPDVLPDENCPPDFAKHFLKIHKNFSEYKKVGFGLRIDDLPDHYPLKSSVVAWESQFWSHPLGENIYEAGIDTTFAVYKPFTYSYMLHPSIRTGEPYVARHLPWYTDPANQTDEDIYYRYRADANVNSWDAGELPERYKKELYKVKNIDTTNADRG